jgi:hypothetical protein
MYESHRHAYLINKMVYIFNRYRDNPKHSIIYEFHDNLKKHLIVYTFLFYFRAWLFGLYSCKFFSILYFTF